MISVTPSGRSASMWTMCSFSNRSMFTTNKPKGSTIDCLLISLPSASSVLVSLNIAPFLPYEKPLGAGGRCTVMVVVGASSSAACGTGISISLASVSRASCRPRARGLVILPKWGQPVQMPGFSVSNFRQGYGPLISRSFCAMRSGS